MIPFKLHFKDKDDPLYIESIGIQLLGGKLRLDSVKNKGTTVFVNLPVEVVVTS